MSDTATIITKLEELDAEMRELRKEGQRRGEDTTRLVRGLGDRMLALEKEQVSLRKKVSELESAQVIQKRVSQEGDEMQMAALTAALSMHSKNVDTRLDKQDAMYQANLDATNKLVKAVGHPVIRWAAGAVAVLFWLLNKYLESKGVKLL